MVWGGVKGVTCGLGIGLSGNTQPANLCGSLKNCHGSFPDHTACPAHLQNIRLVLEWDQEETRVKNMNQMKSMGNQCCVTVMEWIVVKWTDFQHFFSYIKGKACMERLDTTLPIQYINDEKMMSGM